MAFLVGTAGIPSSTKKYNTVSGIKRAKELGLGCLEVQFTHGINMSPQLAEEVGETAKKNKIVLTVHAPFFINLNSKELSKVTASRNRIYQSAKLAALAGAKDVVFHPAYYLGESPEKVYKEVKDQLKLILAKLKKEKIKIRLALETTGKVSQFGSWKEIIDLSKELSYVEPCFDFAHIWARDQKKTDFDEVLEYAKKKLGTSALKDMYIHLSGINVGKTGERSHKFLSESSFPYKKIITTLKKYHCSGIIISESPDPEKDALKLNKLFSRN